MALLIGTPQEASAQAQGQDTFTAEVTLQDALVVNCTSESLNFGTISRPSTYIEFDTVVIAAEADAQPTSSGEALILSGSGGVVACVVTGLTTVDPATATVTLSGGGGTPAGSSLDKVILTGATTVGQSLEANLVTAFVAPAGSGSGGTVFVGGTLTMKAAGAAVTHASAQTYASSSITLTVTD
jgi:hypothetical protein